MKDEGLSALRQRVKSWLGQRSVIWVGPRGEDARPLLQLEQLSQVFSATAALGAISVSEEYCLEEVTGRRMDLDTYSMDEDRSAAVMELRRRLLRSLDGPAVIIPYRPLSLISSCVFSRTRNVCLMGMFHERQATFEHKPWVETELRRVGVKTIPWRYFADADLQLLQEELGARGQLVLRANRSDGGAGLNCATPSDDLAQARPEHLDGFISAAPLMEPHIPLNVNAVVYESGKISIHGPSIQLIGVPECTTRRFGYCGNDFGAIAELDDELLDDFDEMMRRVGQWLSRNGYIGAFGVDAMVFEGELFLTEINARFQGSSALSAEIDWELGRADMYLRHMDAFMGGELGGGPSLRQLANSHPARAQVVLHNVGDRTLSFDAQDRARTDLADLRLLPATAVVEQRAAVCKAVFDCRADAGLRNVTQPVRDFLATMTACLSTSSAARADNPSNREVAALPHRKLNK